MKDVNNGNTPWGVEAQTGRLTHVLLGRPDHFRWVPLNSISAVTLANQEAMGHRFDKQKAMRQHRQMVDIYEANGVRCHFVEADEGLPSSVFTRDSSFMTPLGRVHRQHSDAAPAAGLRCRVRVLPERRHSDLEVGHGGPLRGR